ncbi:MAG: sugar ABC transporter permease [Spirochaetota bacterium]|nr:MAG: sugar ABC transporter permease [Spirochaetota bacterium]
MKDEIRKKNNTLNAYLFLSPALIVLLFIFGYQIVRLFWFSLVKWEGYIYTTEFSNFLYYKQLFTKDMVFKSLFRSFIIIAVVLPVVIFATVFIVHNIYRKVSGWKFYRWLFFLPAIIPIVVQAIIWQYLLNINGPLNTILKALRLEFLVIDWFGNSKTAIFALCWVIIWRELGFSTVIFLAELAHIPPSLYESAMIDGANEWRLMRHITLPHLSRIIKLYIITMTIFILNNLFSIIFASTNGGPGYATMVLEYYIYLTAFRYTKTGLGTTIAVLLFLITMVLVIIYLRASSKKKLEGVF